MPDCASCSTASRITRRSGCSASGGASSTTRELRYEFRKFQAFSEQTARAAGIEPQQHQLLLALRGLPEGARPTIGTVAERLCVQHHTAVALVDKLERQRFLVRERGTHDRREVLLRLTPEGETILRSLSALHRRQLGQVGPAMVAALQSLLAGGEADASAKAEAHASRVRAPKSKVRG